MTWIGLAGRALPLLAAVMAASSQVLTAPEKILAITSLVRLISSAPPSLYEMATGPNTSGRFHAGLPWQRSLALSTSPFSAFSAESEAPKSTWAWLNRLTPLPEPDGL